jgi:hypothetical protein
MDVHRKPNPPSPPNFGRDLTSRHALNGPQITAKGKVMGVFTATARNLFVCLSFFLLLATLAVPLRPALAQSQKPAVG